jgi:hypothetical protein
LGTFDLAEPWPKAVKNESHVVQRSALPPVNRAPWFALVNWAVDVPGVYDCVETNEHVGLTISGTLCNAELWNLIPNVSSMVQEAAATFPVIKTSCPCGPLSRRELR